MGVGATVYQYTQCQGETKRMLAFTYGTAQI